MKVKLNHERKLTKKKQLDKESNSTIQLNKTITLEPQEPIWLCFHCHKPFKIHYNRGIGMSSQKNYWLYWIDDNWDYWYNRSLWR